MFYHILFVKVAMLVSKVSLMCPFPVVGAPPQAGTGGGRPAGAPGGAAQGAGGTGETGAHNHPSQAADGPVWHGGRQPLSSSYPFHRNA